MSGRKHVYTHRGVVNNHNYGQPHKWEVRLRETARLWVTPKGQKFRKADGMPTGADIWNQTHLLLETIQPIEA